MTGRVNTQRVELRGLERMLTMVDGVSMKIVHSMLVAGDAEIMVRFVPVALMRTFNMHPRMRALQVKSENFSVEIQAPVTLDDIATKDLLRVRQFSQSESTEGTFDNWQHYAERECNVGFERYTQFPFFLMLWVDKTAEQGRLILFSDHYMSDGRSGMTVLNCILEQVSLLTEQGNNQSDDRPVHEFPLRPSFYEMWLSKNFIFKELLKGLMSLFGGAIYRSEMKKFKALLPARNDQHNFVAPPVANSTTASFAEGDSICMRRSLEKCTEESVTFGGALVAAIALAFYHAANKQPNFQPDQPFKVAADIDYNMRQRVPCPAEEDQVGAYIAFADLGWFATKGVDMETTLFWDLARRAKTEIDGNLRNTTTMSALTVTMDQKLNAKMKPSLPKSVRIRHSQTSDANISNVGRYPYAKEYSLSSKRDKKNVLAVKNLHVYNPIPHLGPSAVFFVTSVESFCYAMGHKCEDEAAKSLFSAWVAICEHLGNVGADDTLMGVLEHLNL